MELWNDCIPHLQLCQSLTFLATLAIYQNDPKFALEILDTKPGNYLASENVRLLALAELKEFKEICKILYDIQCQQNRRIGTQVSIHVVS